MGKSSLCLQMLQLLNTGRVYKCSELAELLETNSRNIIEYKKELEEAGYYITSIPGKYGGYKLEKTGLIPSIKLLESEKKSIAEAYDYILKKKDFIFKNEFEKSISKVFSTAGISTNSNLMVIETKQLTLTEEEIKDRYIILEQAISKKMSIEILYNDTLLEINPYKLFIYDGVWAVLAWSLDDCDILFYKLSEIKSYKLLNKKFVVHKYFDASKYFESNGIVVNKEIYEIELIVTNNALKLFKNNIIGKKQQISKRRKP